MWLGARLRLNLNYESPRLSSCGLASGGSLAAASPFPSGLILEPEYAGLGVNAASVTVVWLGILQPARPSTSPIQSFEARGCVVQVGNGTGIDPSLEAVGLQLEPYRWRPCGVPCRTVVVIKLRRTSALGANSRPVCLFVSDENSRSNYNALNIFKTKPLCDFF